MLPRPGLVPAPPAIWTMRPHRFSRIYGITSCDIRRYPWALSAIPSSICSVGRSRMSPPRAAPAQLMRMSMPPKVPAASRTTRRQSSIKVRSAVTASPSPPVPAFWPLSTFWSPAASISRTTSSSRSRFRAVTHTRAPSRARASAQQRPMPRLPPVTIALLPRSFRSMITVSDRSSRAPRRACPAAGGLAGHADRPCSLPEWRRGSGVSVCFGQIHRVDALDHLRHAADLVGIVAPGQDPPGAGEAQGEMQRVHVEIDRVVVELVFR